MSSEAQRRATNKYNAKTNKIIACKVKISVYREIEEYCKNNGITLNALIKDAITLKTGIKTE